MITTKTIAQLLHMTEEQYNELYTEKYMRWCLNRSKGDQDFQKLLANTSISKWYNHEFGKIEEKYLQAMAPIFSNVCVKTSRNIFESISIDLYSKFPMPLIEQARTLNVNPHAN